MIFKLTGKTPVGEEIIFAQKIQQTFGVTSGKDIIIFHIKSDVTLSTDVFESFIET